MQSYSQLDSGPVKQTSEFKHGLNIVTSLPLQMAIYFNSFYFPFWFLSFLISFITKVIFQMNYCTRILTIFVSLLFSDSCSRTGVSSYRWSLPSDYDSCGGTAFVFWSQWKLEGGYFSVGRLLATYSFNSIANDLFPFVHTSNKKFAF